MKIMSMTVYIRGITPTKLSKKVCFNKIYWRFFSTKTKHKMSDSMYKVYHSVDAILDDMEKEKEDPMVQKVLTTYYESVEKVESFRRTCVSSQRYPFIVFEGLDACGKSTLSRLLSKKICGKQSQTPPKEFSSIREYFTYHKLRTAFYSLGNYIEANNIEPLLYESPIVMDRYWHSTTIYAIAESVRHTSEQFPSMPGENNPIYDWPKDLLKPDIIIFLKVSEEARLKRIQHRTNITDQENNLKTDVTFRKNILSAYEKVKNPSVTMIDSDPPIATVLENLIEKTKYLFVK